MGGKERQEHIKQKRGKEDLPLDNRFVERGGDWSLLSMLLLGLLLELVFVLLCVNDIINVRRSKEQESKSGNSVLCCHLQKNSHLFPHFPFSSFSFGVKEVSFCNNFFLSHVKRTRTQGTLLKNK